MSRPAAVLPRLLALCHAVLILSAAPAAGKGPPRSVILIVADGTGMAALHQALAADRGGLPRGLAGIEAFLEKSRGASILTLSSGGKVTDSAAAATAMSCGVKTTNRTVGLDPQGKRPSCIPDIARKTGKAIGLVSTSESWDATPAAFSGYAKSRKDRLKIQRRQAELKPEILAGKDIGPVDLAREARLALERLSGDPDGFFLFLECEDTDTAAHRNDWPSFLGALRALDPALRIVMDYQAAHPETTVFFVSDHDTGGITPEGEWTTHEHTASPAFLYALGPGAEKVTGLMDNTRIHALLEGAL